MSKERIERVIRSAYEARGRGDLDGVMRHFAGHAHFSIAGSTAASAVPASATGIAPIREIMLRLFETFEMSHLAILSLIVDGEEAAVHSRVRIKPVGGVDEVETELVDLIRIEGETIVSFQQFADTALAARLLGH